MKFKIGEMIMMKIGLIRCFQTEDICRGKHCLTCIDNKEGAFAEVDEEIDLIGITTCGGCPGEGIDKRVRNMIEEGVGTIVFGSCIKLGTPMDFPCPNLDQLKATINEESESIDIIEWTHYSTFKEVLINRIKTTNLSNLDRFFKKGLTL